MMRTEKFTEDQTILFKKALTTLIQGYIKIFGYELTEKEIEAIVNALLEYDVSNIVELRIHRMFILQETPESPDADAKLYFSDNAISLVLAEEDQNTLKTKLHEVHVIGDKYLVGEGNKYTLYSIAIPIVRVLNILTSTLTQDIQEDESEVTIND